MGKAAMAMARFGALLRTERERRDGWSLARVVGKIHRATTALESFDSSQLYRYEKGEVERPDPLALFHLANIYGLKYEDLILVLQEDREASEAIDARQVRRMVVGESPPGRPQPIRGRRPGSR